MPDLRLKIFRYQWNSLSLYPPVCCVSSLSGGDISYGTVQLSIIQGSYDNFMDFEAV